MSNYATSRTGRWQPRFGQNGLLYFSQAISSVSSLSVGVKQALIMQSPSCMIRGLISGLIPPSQVWALPMDRFADRPTWTTKLRPRAAQLSCIWAHCQTVTVVCMQLRYIVKTCVGEVTNRLHWLNHLLSPCLFLRKYLTLWISKKTIMKPCMGKKHDEQRHSVPCIARLACGQRGAQLCGTDCRHGAYPAWTRSSSLATLPSEVQQELPGSYRQDNPLPAAGVTAAGQRSDYQEVASK